VRLTKRSRVMVGLVWLCAAFDWPVTDSVAMRSDGFARFRWESLGTWRTPAPAEARTFLANLERLPPTESQSMRVVLLRLLGREEEVRVALSTAIARSALVLDDPDVALTAAWMAARHGDFAQATALGRRALARMNTQNVQTLQRRESLVLEVARWSMARGSDGLPDAIALLRGHTVLVAASSMVRATLALCLLRQGHVDEARWTVTSIASGLHPEDGVQQVAGAVVSGDGDAAIGVALRLSGRTRDALVPLERAMRTVPEVWRGFQSHEFELARRGDHG
jgi:hypothetical protein